MKEQIYAIPVNDAFKADTECAFCHMKDLLEKQSIDFVMGSSYMEDDIRMETNRVGFCKIHYQKMYDRQNRQGLAIMLQTHLQQINRDLSNILKTTPSVSKKNIFSKPSLDSNELSEYTNRLDNSCYICDRINNMYEHFIDTFFYLFKKDKNFVELVKNSKGFCINHFTEIYQKAPLKMTANECNEFYKMIIPIEIENLSRIQEEIDWFVNKFDYRYTNEPWKNSKDALPRTIEKISSALVDN